MASPQYTAGGDAEWEKLKKVVLECQPFADGTSTLVCVNCFRLLAFPSGSKKIKCGQCSSLTSGIQAKCVSCGHSLRIPLSCKEAQCPKCLYTFKPMATLRVRVPEVLSKSLPPPIVLNITLHDNVGMCKKPEFTSRIIISKPLSINIAMWEMASGASFHRVQFFKKNPGSDVEFALDASRTPVELQLKDNDHILVKALSNASAKSASVSSSAHDFQETTMSAPTNCSVCHEFIWGVFKQGKKCVRCGVPVHHRCAEDATQMCDAARRQLFGIMDFGEGAGLDSDDDDGDDANSNTADRSGEGDADAILAVPIEDVTAFMAATKEQVPTECDPDQMAKLANLAKFSDEEIATLWQKYDANNNGQIDQNEALHFLSDCVSSFDSGKKLDPKDPKNTDVLARLLRRLDTNEDGVVTWDEWYWFFQTQKDIAFLQQFAGTKTEFTTEQLYEMWDNYDTDKSGELDADEVLRLLSDITHTDPASLKDIKSKKHKLSSFLKTGQKVTWDIFYSSFVPIIQAAVQNAKEQPSA